jgi:hypothetical protein
VGKENGIQEVKAWRNAMLRISCCPVVCEDMVGLLLLLMRLELRTRLRESFLIIMTTSSRRILVRGSRLLALREHRRRHRGINLRDGRLSVRIGLFLRFDRLCRTKCRVPVVSLVELAQPGILSSWTGRQQIGRLGPLFSIVVTRYCEYRSATRSIRGRQAVRLP